MKKKIINVYGQICGFSFALLLFSRSGLLATAIDVFTEGRGGRGLEGAIAQDGSFLGPELFCTANLSLTNYHVLTPY